MQTRKELATIKAIVEMRSELLTFTGNHGRVVGMDTTWQRP